MRASEPTATRASCIEEDHPVERVRAPQQRLECREATVAVLYTLRPS